MEKFPILNEKLDAGVMRKPEFGPISLDLESKTLCLTGTETKVKLNSQEYQILWLLVRANGNIISETEMSNFLYEDIPDDKDLPLSNGTEVTINKLKKKLNEVANNKVEIMNRIQIGYWLEVHNH